jgi:hypothetical protein
MEWRGPVILRYGPYDGTKIFVCGLKYVRINDCVYEPRPDSMDKQSFFFKEDDATK